MLASCAKPPYSPTPEVQTQFLKQKIQIQQRPRPVELQNVGFYVVTEENFNEFKARFIDENGEFTFIAISIPDYEKLSMNLAEIQRYIRQQNEIIFFYEKAISAD